MLSIEGEFRMLRRLLLPLAVAAALVAASVASAKDGAGLRGEVGPGYTIEVNNGSRDLKTVKAGTYTIKVEDKSTFHNFHLKGPGLNKSTTIAFQGETSWRVKLRPGTYTYQCDAHASQGMKGHFRVTG
jgi:plastocyanin